MSTQTCLHVRVTATRKELMKAGILSESKLDLLTSKRVFAVERRQNVGGGETLVHLVHPEGSGQTLWVYARHVWPLEWGKWNAK